MSNGILASASDVHEPAANTAAAVTYPADEGRSHVITGIAWSYDALPTGGSLTVKDGTDTVFVIGITSKGPGAIEFPEPKKGGRNKSMTVTLAAGGEGVTGKLSVLNHRLDR